MKVVITQEHIAKLLGLDNTGEVISNYKKAVTHQESIRVYLFEPNFGCGKARNLLDESKIIFRIMQNFVFTRDGGNDTISWEHKHFIYFLTKIVKINLAACLVEHLRTSIKDGNYKKKTSIHHLRLLFELLRQTNLIDLLKRNCVEAVREIRGGKFDA
jgi:hypothetical protein